jgi:hypothetical protein
MATRFPMVLICFAASVAEEATQPAVRAELQRVIDAIQRAKEPDLQEFASPPHAQTVVTGIRGFQKFLREQRDGAMSELSPPILIPVSVTGSDGDKKARVCVHAVQYGSVMNRLLTSVEFNFEKVKDRWRIESVRRDAGCGMLSNDKEMGRGGASAVVECRFS